MSDSCAISPILKFTHHVVCVPVPIENGLAQPLAEGHFFGTWHVKLLLPTRYRAEGGSYALVVRNSRTAVGGSIAGPGFKEAGLSSSDLVAEDLLRGAYPL